MHPRTPASPEPVGTPPEGWSGWPACPNCGTPVADRFCPHCGQEYADRLPSVRRMAVQFLDDQFSLNGTLPRTLGALFFRPGFLTHEYVAGRIVRYVRPFRLFLISSLLFFVILSLIADAEAVLRAGGEEAVSTAPQVDAATGARWDNVNLGVDSSSTPRWSRPLVRRALEQQDRLNALPPAAAVAAIMEALLQASARMSFLLVPAFAALLLALHFRRRPRYVEHFVFALHFHAFVFLLLTPLLLIGSGFLWGLAALWSALYLVLALRRAYGQPWWLAGAKFLVVATVYPVALSVAIGIASLVALLAA